jgi:hypothetical protein
MNSNFLRMEMDADEYAEYQSHQAERRDMAESMD